MRLLFDDGRVRLYHGDACEVLEELRPLGVDVLLTDPPYGVGYTSPAKATAGGSLRGDGHRQGVRLLRRVLGALTPHWAPDAHAYVCCSWDCWPDFYDAACAHMAIKNALVWDKDSLGQGDTRREYGRDYEVILYGSRGSRPLSGGREPSILRGHRAPDYRRRIHPTEKPVSLLEGLVRKSCPPDGLVLDPFAGSASSLIAARRCGVRAIGVEVDESRIEAAVARLMATAELPASDAAA